MTTLTSTTVDTTTITATAGTLTGITNLVATGGTITGITDLAVADGGTGSSTAAAARTALGVAIGSDVQAYDVDTAKLDVVQTWTAAQRGTVTALTSSGASIAINLATTNNWSHTLTENTTLAAPSNPVAGQSGVITFTQHASAPKTLAYNTFWKFPGGVVPTLTATNSAIDVFTYYVISGTQAVCQLLKGIA